MLELDALCAWLPLWRPAVLDFAGDALMGDSLAAAAAVARAALGRHAIRSVFRFTRRRAKTLGGASALTACRWVDEHGALC